MTAPHRRAPTALDYSPVAEGARRLWRELDDLARERASVYVTVSQLATNLGCTERSVRNWRKALVDAGWLRVRAGRGRGDTSLWTPLGRARAVTNQAPEPVDNSPKRRNERRNERPASDQGKAERMTPLVRGALQGTRAREEEEALCPDCEAGWVDVPDPDSRDGYRLARCRSCSPAPF